MLAILVALVVARKRKPINQARDAARIIAGDEPDETVFNKPHFSEYVLDGRDESGIRYLLRISVDQLVTKAGVVIGRNTADFPYIINHADVSRQHARMKVLKTLDQQMEPQ